MKTKFNTNFILSVLIVLIFTSCQEEFDSNSQNIVTDLKQLFTDKNIAYQTPQDQSLGMTSTAKRKLIASVQISNRDLVANYESISSVFNKNGLEIVTTNTINKYNNQGRVEQEEGYWRTYTYDDGSVILAYYGPNCTQDYYYPPNSTNWTSTFGDCDQE